MEIEFKNASSGSVRVHLVLQFGFPSLINSYVPDF